MGKSDGIVIIQLQQDLLALTLAGAIRQTTDLRPASVYASWPGKVRQDFSDPACWQTCSPRQLVKCRAP